MNEQNKIDFPLQIANDEKEIQQLNTDKARLMHEVQRLMQAVEHLESTMNDSEEGHASEVNITVDLLYLLTTKIAFQEFDFLSEIALS